jgi:carbon monoxide dehydrogenase subunit G
MTIDDAFEIRAPLARVWPVLKDVPRVASCMPNAEITEVVDDKTYRAKVSVKVGPVSVSYNATVRVEWIDDQTHAVTMAVQGDELRGRGGVRAAITSQAEEQGDVTRVKLHTDAQVSGIIATVGSRLIESVAKKTIAQFASNLAALV